MANTNGPFGLRPSRSASGGEPRTTQYTITAASAAAIYLGDPVGFSSGTVVIGTDAGTAHLGVFAGCQYVNASGDIIFSKRWPADTGASEVKALVWDDPNQLFTIQSDGTTATTVASIGVAYDLDVTAGTASIGVSKTVLQPGATSGAAYKVLGLIDKPDNAWGIYSEVEVIAVKHALAS